MIDDLILKEELQGGKDIEQINQQLELRDTVNKYKYVELYNKDRKQNKLISRSSALQEDQIKLKMAI